MPERDSNLFFQKIIADIKADTTIAGICAKKANNDPFVSPSRYVPVGNKYPQVTVTLDFQKSEEQFPAGYYNLIIRYWMQKEEKRQFQKSFAFRDAIDALFNRKGSQLNQIDIPGNTGLRVAQVLRRFGEFAFDREHDKYYVDYRFDVVMSEDESFASDDAGDKPWV